MKKRESKKNGYQTIGSIATNDVVLSFTRLLLLLLLVVVVVVVVVEVVLSSLEFFFLHQR